MAFPRKPPTTKLSVACRALAEVQEDDITRSRLERAAVDLDRTAILVGARGPRVKQLGAYMYARQLYDGISAVPFKG